MKKISILFFLIITQSYGQVVLTHSIGDNFIGTSIYGCSDCCLRWSRVFDLQDFDITQDLMLISGTTAFRVGDVNNIQYRYNVYAIDDNFPSSFDESSLLGSSQLNTAFFSSNNHVISELQFENPIIVPQGTLKILVEVKQETGDVVFMSGTAEDTGLSWFKSDAGGCSPNNYTTTVDLNRPDAKFYIKVFGDEFLGLEDNSKIDFNIYPIPSNRSIEIIGSDVNNISEISIYNINGHLVDSYRKNIEELDISNYTNGIYFLTAISNNDQVETRKFIKN